MPVSAFFEVSEDGFGNVSLTEGYIPKLSVFALLVNETVINSSITTDANIYFALPLYTLSITVGGKNNHIRLNLL